MINEFSISTNEIIQIILQYLKENNLNSSYQTLQKETGIKDNCLLFSSINELKKNIEQGNWDLVLKEINHMTIPFVLLLELYELIIVELIASKEKDIAKCILYHLSDNFVKEIKGSKTLYQDKFSFLENIINGTVNYEQYYRERNTNKEKCRENIAQKMKEWFRPIEKGRLLYLLGHALQSVYNSEMKKDGNIYSYNILSNKFIYNEKKQLEDSNQEENEFIKIKQQAKYNPHNNSPGTTIEYLDADIQGKFMSLGLSNGEIEIWDISKNFSYLKSLQSHSHPIICSSFSNDSQLFCSSNTKINVSIFNLETSSIITQFDQVHTKPITSIKFTHDSSSILSCSLDGSISIIGLNSNQLLCQIKAHSSFINDMCINLNNDNVFTAGSDGYVKIINSKERCIIKELYIKNEDGPETYETSINCIKLSHLNPNYIFCGTMEGITYLIDTKGKIISKYKSNNISNIMCIELHNKWMYTLDTDNNITIFNIEHVIMVNYEKIMNENVIIGIKYLPNQKYLIGYTNNEIVTFI